MQEAIPSDPVTQEPNRRGPKYIPIDWDHFDALCAIQCTLTEIAAVFRCSVDTIERAVERERGMKFAEYFSEKRAVGVMSLRRDMFKAAQKGSVPMMIWLSKNIMNYTDRMAQDIQHTGQLQVKPVPSETMEKIFSDPESTRLAHELALRLSRKEPQGGDKPHED